MPSAATSGGSQSEWSASGKLATKPSDATGTSMRNVFTAIAERTELVRGRDGEVLERGLGHPVRHQAGEVVERRRSTRCSGSRPRRGPHVRAARRGSRRSGARRSTCITRSKRFIGSSRSPGNVIAALFTRMSTRPNVLDRGRDHRARPRSSFARLVGTAIASPPASLDRRTVSSIVPGIGSGVASVARAAHATAHPRCGERERGRGADTAARAGDDRDLPVEFHGREARGPARSWCTVSVSA